MRDLLGREIHPGDIVAVMANRLLVVNVVDVAPFAVQVAHVAGDKVVEAVLTNPQAVVIVHEAEEDLPYPTNAPQPTLH